MENPEILQKMADTIRFLSADMVESANSGHPGAPMGLSDLVTVLSYYLKVNPKNPKWLNRDRLIFSGGHASALIYSFSHLIGYDITLEDLKNFRQLGSKTAGHPEYGHIEGVEVTTGPLGQGFANAVGFALSAKYAQYLFGEELFNHKVYCFCGDGDLQEGISYEASSIAGHHKLDNLVFIYDNNNIIIEGEAKEVFSEDVKTRFESCGFDVIEIDGHNYKEIDFAFKKAQNQTKPLLIIATTKIAKGSATLEGSHHTHGSPLGKEDVAKSKELANFPKDNFFVDEDVRFRFSRVAEVGEVLEKEWKNLVAQLPKDRLDLYHAMQNPDFSNIIYPNFSSEKEAATRDSNGKILNAIAKAVPSFIGGSADLAPSNKTELKDMGYFPNGKNIKFGIREHAMGAISNAISLYGLFVPFSATFFVFSDYLKPSIRVASLMETKQFFIFTHDSIGVGEDGPTHQPIEHLSQFRALPNLNVYRPADAIENVDCWRSALSQNIPSTFVLSRQKLPILNREKSFGDVLKGGYLVIKNEQPQVTLIATGSEVGIAVEACYELAKIGIVANVASIPCFDIFAKNDESYINSIINPNLKALAIEAGSGLEWYRFADEVICMSSFGASGKDKHLFEKFGFTPSNIVLKVQKLLAK